MLCSGRARRVDSLSFSNASWGACGTASAQAHFECISGPWRPQRYAACCTRHLCAPCALPLRPPGRCSCRVMARRWTIAAGAVHVDNCTRPAGRPVRCACGGLDFSALLESLRSDSHVLGDASATITFLCVFWAIYSCGSRVYNWDGYHIHHSQPQATGRAKHER